MTCAYLVYGLHHLFSCKIDKVLVVVYVISILGPLLQGSQWHSLQVLEVGTLLLIVDF